MGPHQGFVDGPEVLRAVPRAEELGHSIQQPVDRGFPTPGAGVDLSR
ncbi:hypothetical protein [Kytococcus sedentarius]|nr:hypothetical protein [Kytococcus sedentarius]